MDKRYVVAYGEIMERRVARAPEREKGDFLTKAEAASRIVAEMDCMIAAAKDSRRRAKRILSNEARKAVQP